ncbi:acyltransferase [Roseomonas sp. OT10]|uniref:acyltransferase family protein n=1 Tax=Roseomonas cutis TaxID=2897332 RepID=UPI001E524901|nr:acyltransferase [Roseomonas sp. OT10]UFN46971.1 acyltransferase [Roseomonas sp. OT10]
MQNNLAGIQYLRAFAALAVVAYHALAEAGGGFLVGAAGVDLFFVISGFIMYAVATRRSPSPGSFLWNRLVRVAPPYWAITVLLVFLSIVFPSLVPALKPDLGRLLSSLAFIPHADPQGNVWPILVPGWTLNYEMFFYLVFAAALTFPRAYRLAVTTAAMVGLVMLGLIVRPTHPIPFTYTHPLLLEFVAGIWIGHFWTSRTLPGRRMGWLLIAMSLGCFAALGATGFYSEAWRVVLWGVPSALLLGGVVCLEAQGGIARLPLLHRIGDASYSLYLTHTLLVAAAWKVLSFLPPVAFAGACMLLGSLVGIACYGLFERPLTAWLRALPGRFRSRLTVAPELP